MRFVFIINPIAGNRTLQPKLKEKIRSMPNKENIQFSVFESEYAGHSKEIAEREAKKGDEVTVFACGGDGTVFDVLNGIYGYQNASIGIIPLGTGNDFIKSIGIKSDFLNIEYQISGGFRPVDVIKCGENVALNVACAGFDAHVADNMSRFKKKRFITGSVSYLISVFYCLFRFYSSKYRLIIDGTEKHEDDYMFAVGANASYYGGGFYPAPDAKLDDGYLDAVEVKRVSHPAFLTLINKYRKGLLNGKNFYSVTKAKKLVIECDEEIVVNLDGETVRFQNGRVEFENIHNAVKLWLPKNLLNSPCFSEKYEQKVKITEST